MTAETYASGTAPLKTDPIRKLEVKILNALRAGGGAGTGNLSYTEGAGAPVANPAALLQHWLYRDTNTGDIYFWDTNTQAWV